MPYKALDSLIDALSRYLKRLPRMRRRRCCRATSSRSRASSPCCARSRPWPGAPRAVEIPDPQELRRRAFAALRELLARLADRKPLVLFIDDLQWGDADSAALLPRSAAAPRPAGTPAAGVLSQRGCDGESAAGSHRALGDLFGRASRSPVLGGRSTDPTRGRRPGEDAPRSGRNRLPGPRIQQSRGSRAETRSTSPSSCAISRPVPSLDSTSFAVRKSPSTKSFGTASWACQKSRAGSWRPLPFPADPWGKMWRVGPPRWGRMSRAAASRSCGLGSVDPGGGPHGCRDRDLS